MVSRIRNHSTTSCASGHRKFLEYNTCVWEEEEKKEVSKEIDITYQLIALEETLKKKHTGKTDEFWTFHMIASVHVKSDNTS